MFIHVSFTFSHFCFYSKNQADILLNQIKLLLLFLFQVPIYIWKITLLNFLWCPKRVWPWKLFSLILGNIENWLDAREIVAGKAKDIWVDTEKTPIIDISSSTIFSFPETPTSQLTFSMVRIWVRLLDSLMLRYAPLLYFKAILLFFRYDLLYCLE